MNYALEATAINSFQQRRGGSNYQYNNNRSFPNQNSNYNSQQDGNYQPNRSYNSMNSPQPFNQQNYRNNQNNSRNYQQQRGGDEMGYSNDRGQPHQNQYNQNQNNQNNNRQNNFYGHNNNNRSNDYNHPLNNVPYQGNKSNFGNNERGGNMGNRNNWNNYNGDNQRYPQQNSQMYQNYDDISEQFKPQPINNPYNQNYRQSVSPQTNYQNQNNQGRTNGGYNNSNINDRNGNSFNRGRGGRGGGRGSFGGNRYDGQRNQYQNYRGQEARYEPQRELSQAQLVQMLRQRNNQEIQIYPNFNFPPSATIENRNQVYIFSNDEKGKISNSQGGIANLKGPRKIDIPSSAGLKNFYDFPGLPNRGQLQRERVLGFKQITGINFNDFQRRGMELMQEIVGSIESYK